jgi:two-component system response regulator GlrR
MAERTTGTRIIERPGEPDAVLVRDVTLRVIDGGPEAVAVPLGLASVRVGSGEDADLRLDDAAVSRAHVALRLVPHGCEIRDLDSKNGTFVDGVRVESAWLRNDSRLQLGDVTVRFRERGGVVLPVSSASSFGGLVGRSLAMRRLFALLERCAQSDVTVLIHGETGTGKEGAAEAIHGASRRASAPFVVVDCAAIPPALLESELFGHEKGSFTGAHGQRIGAFEEANGGTVFLDEIGEIPIDLQPKLLRVLERKTIRRVGSNRQIPVDVRILAATHRSLQKEVNDGTFRADLYYRLAVVKVELPPLRERLDDLPDLVETLLAQLGVRGEAHARLTSAPFLARLTSHPLAGNVRELRNLLERALVLEDAFDGTQSTQARVIDEDDADVSLPAITLSYGEARTRVLDDFERRWLAALLSAHGGNVAAAARAAEIARPYLHRLLQRHGITRRSVMPPSG